MTPIRLTSFYSALFLGFLVKHWIKTSCINHLDFKINPGLRLNRKKKPFGRENGQKRRICAVLILLVLLNVLQRANYLLHNLSSRKFIVWAVWSQRMTSFCSHKRNINKKSVTRDQLIGAITNSRTVENLSSNCNHLLIATGFWLAFAISVLFFSFILFLIKFI